MVNHNFWNTKKERVPAHCVVLSRIFHQSSGGTYYKSKIRHDLHVTVVLFLHITGVFFSQVGIIKENEIVYLP